MSATLRLDRLSVRRGGRDILREVSAEFRAGAVTALCGPNGAGKSTLVQAMAGLLPSRGSCRLDGRAAPTSADLAYLPQSTAVRASLTVFEVVLLGRIERLRWHLSAGDLDAAARTIAAVGLADLAQRVMATLSGGQQQLVLLAQRLVREPHILLLDEPTSALDLRRQLLVLDLISGYARERDAVVVAVLHDLSLAARYASRLLLLHEGRLVADGPPAEVLTAGILRGVYGVEVEILRSSGGDPLVAPMKPADRPG